jgi:hypothetical protein
MQHSLILSIFINNKASIYQTANATASTFGGGPFSRLDANNKTKME